MLLLLLLPSAALAHPMGNFSVNHYSKLTLESNEVIVQFLIDLAEIPTYQELQQGNITALPHDPAVIHFLATRGKELSKELALTLDGKPLPLRLISSAVIFPPGAGGLPTMKMAFNYEAVYPDQADGAHARLSYFDNTYVGHTGWKEVIAVAGTGTLLQSSVPARDRSAGLTNYPTDLLSSPPQTLEASLEIELHHVTAPPVAAKTQLHSAPTPTTLQADVTTGLPRSRRSPPHRVREPEFTSAPTVVKPESTSTIVPTNDPVTLQANQQKTPRNRFTEIITAQRLSPWFLFTAALLAMGLGALHALEPGHGKTIVAAYLIGSRGTARHAALLGLIVTGSHTAGVFALGAITLYASRYIVPEQLYPWLGVLSGIIIMALGCYMFLRRVTGTATEHSHLETGAHSGWFSKRSTAAVESSSPARRQPVSFTQLFALGVTGGIIPCPAALIVLLSAFALHRIALGFFLIVALSLGLASVLIVFGMLMVYARQLIARLHMDGPLTMRWLPIASSAFIVLLGIGLTVQAFASIHLRLPSLNKEGLGPALFVAGLGLVLGVRHSTDADHVVAISTIVSKQRSIRNAAFIGSVWGLGHTITIFVVGSLIILFGVEIPPRIGLSMEFSVAIMLIVLGILNLTGLMQKITARYSSARLVTPDGPGTVESQLDVRSAAAQGGLIKMSARRLGLYQLIRPLVIGLVHGLAGSAAVALLVLSTIHNPIWATVYLVIFGAGTVIGMMCMTAAMALPLAFAGDRFQKMSNYLGMASGMVSFCFGSFLAYQLGFVGGLFTNHPTWVPR